MATLAFAWGIDIGTAPSRRSSSSATATPSASTTSTVIEHETVLSNSGDNRER
jgi:hypothetical protein